MAIGENSGARQRLREVFRSSRGTALVLVDLQQDITAAEFSPRSGTEIVAQARQLRDSVQAAGGRVVFVHHDGKASRRRPQHTDMAVANNTGLASGVSFDESLSPGPDDLVVRKRQWGAFYGTDLDQMLRIHDIDTIILCGVTTNFGVESTAREAHPRGYQLILPTDAMGSIDEAHHRFSVDYVLPRLGLVTSVDAVVKALKSVAASDTGASTGGVS